MDEVQQAKHLMNRFVTAVLLDKPNVRIFALVAVVIGAKLADRLPCLINRSMSCGRGNFSRQYM